MSDKDTEALFVFGGLINFSYICAELILYQRLKQIESMKTKVLLAAVAVFYILFPLSYFIYSSYLYSVLKGIVNPLISEQFNLFTKESNIAVKQIRETSVIYCRIIRRHENNCKDILDMHATDVDLQH